MRVQVKIWLEHDKTIVFGKGHVLLLKAIDKTGSITKAAKELNMSYRNAWGRISYAENKIGKPLLIRARGGKNYGGAQLTEFAKTLLTQFSHLKQQSEKFAEQKFKDLF